jgi:hypothetical protein
VGQSWWSFALIAAVAGQQKSIALRLLRAGASAGDLGGAAAAARVVGWLQAEAEALRQENARANERFRAAIPVLLQWGRL